MKNYALCEQRLTIKKNKKCHVISKNMRNDIENKPKSEPRYEDFTGDISPAEFKTRYIHYIKETGK